MPEHPMPFLDHLEIIHDATFRDGPEQMAMDEALFQLRSSPVLRFFSWSSPQITFGYFGNYDEITKENPGCLLTRRWTGGGVVAHGSDLTFSLIVPASHPASQWRGSAIYCSIHRAVATALSASGSAVFLVGETEKAAPGSHCFLSPVPGDVLQGDQKLAGGAMRRTKNGVLYQGSIQIPGAFSGGEIYQKVRQDLAISLSSSRSDSELQPADTQLAEELTHTRYSHPDWLTGNNRLPVK